METQVMEQTAAEQAQDTTQQPTAEVKQEGDTKQVAPPTQTPAPTAPTPYTPDWKYRANNKEHEIPELFRGIVKDEKAEKYIKDIFQKAHGLEPIKERLNGIRGEYHELQNTYNSVMGQIEDARAAYQRGDMDSVFDTLRIAPEKVLQWAVEKVQLSQMPPEQRQAIEARQMAEKRAYELEKQTYSSSQEVMKQQGQYISQMLDLVLERPDYSAVAQAYDTRKASPGAFRDLVIKVGQSETALSGKVLTPLEAAQKALEWIGEKLDRPATPKEVQTPAQQVEQATPATPQQPKKQVLPNMANAGAKPGAAPAKGKLKSLDDIKKVYDQKYGPNNL